MECLAVSKFPDAAHWTWEIKIDGHSNIKQSSRYVHPSDDAVIGAMERMGAQNWAQRQKCSSSSNNTEATNAMIQKKKYGGRDRDRTGDPCLQSRPGKTLIWNDLSTRNSVLSFLFHSCSSQEAAQVAVGEAITTIDHSDIRGSEPHNRDPSGAASELKARVWCKTYGIGWSRILLRVPSTATHAASCDPLTFSKLFLRPLAARILSAALPPVRQ